MTVTWSLDELFSRSSDTPQTNPALLRWRTLLRWAARTPFYQAQDNILDSDHENLHSLNDIQEILKAFPKVPLDRLLSSPASFRSNYPRPSPPQPAWSFWDTPARIAVIDAWFPCAEPTRAIAGRRSLPALAKAINRFQPDVLVATPTQLLRLARLNCVKPARVLISIQAPGTKTLTEAARDYLWRQFRVPVYQQFRGYQGELLASECDMQKGLHANQQYAHWEHSSGDLLVTSLKNLRHPVVRLVTGWTGDLETSRCGCGCLSARVFPYEPRSHSTRDLGQLIEAPNGTSIHDARTLSLATS
jgi:hypothetical protein